MKEENSAIMKRCLWKFFVLVLLIVRCSDEQVEQPPENDEPEVTGIGTPLGDPVTIDIDAAGGSLTSEDERLTLTVPAGAVSSNTTFSIQPIVDFCPGGMGSYRLLPEGLTFSTPVTITFNYTEEDLEGTLSEFLDIAYQGSDYVWYSLTWVTVDEAAKTISAPVKHFTNWSWADRLRIEPRLPGIPVIEKGSTYDLRLAGAKYQPAKKVVEENPNPDDDDLPPLPRPKRIPFDATWYVNGVTNGNQNVGTISVTSKTKVTYQAPAEVPANNPVLISAELSNFEAWSSIAGKVKTYEKVILFKRIKIRPDEYNFTLEIKVEYNVPCYPGQAYKDAVEMDVQVKKQNGRDTVIFSNIVNHDATINPFQVTVEDCTISCFTGGVGIVNVTKGTGVADTEDNELVIDLQNTNATDPKSKLDCPNQPGTIPTFTPYSHIYHLVFNLSADRDQISTDGGIWAKLSPK